MLMPSIATWGVFSSMSLCAVALQVFSQPEAELQDEFCRRLQQIQKDVEESYHEGKKQLSDFQKIPEVHQLHLMVRTGMDCKLCIVVAMRSEDMLLCSIPACLTDNFVFDHLYYPTYHLPNPSNADLAIATAIRSLLSQLCRWS